MTEQYPCAKCGATTYSKTRLCRIHNPNYNRARFIQNLSRYRTSKRQWERRKKEGRK